MNMNIHIGNRTQIVFLRHEIHFYQLFRMISIHYLMCAHVEIVFFSIE